MKRVRLVWHIYPAFLALVVLCLATVAWYSARTMRAFHEQQVKGALETAARLVGAQAREWLTRQQTESLQEAFEELGTATGARYTAMDPSGRVLADSDGHPATMDLHDDRPEVIDALRGGVGVSTRYSRTVRQRMMYVAVGVRNGDHVLGVVRASLPLTVVEEHIAALRRRILAAGALACVAAGIVGLLVARRIARPVAEMRQAAERFANGDLSRRLEPANSLELAALAETLNTMAGQLDERMRAVARQQAEMRAILSSMVEGVLAVDSSDRIITLNEAAGELLGVDPAAAAGRSLAEVVRIPKLRSFVAEAARAPAPVKAEIAFHGETERSIEANGAVLRDESGSGQGAVVVLYDVTHLRRLEGVRRDFVANVSHELRTPVTSIQGFVETLLGGAMKDPDAAGRFLRIIAKQTERLSAIIEDLLTLSRMEHHGEREEVQPQSGRVRPVLENALEICEPKAKDRGIELRLQCDSLLSARVIPALLEQAVVNLVDNAIKYSAEGSAVEIEAERVGNEALVHIRDRGCGVPPEERRRIFERFYRVDKARSRSLGGTGLGLSIVKHIAQAHGGSVTVDSKLGEGSVFTLRLRADLPSRRSNTHLFPA